MINFSEFFYFKLAVESLVFVCLFPCPAAGFDFCAHISEPYTLKPGEIHAFGTGVGVEIPEGYELQIRSRSGLAYKHCISLLNGIGTIEKPGDEEKPVEEQKEEEAPVVDELPKKRTIRVKKAEDTEE